MSMPAANAPASTPEPIRLDTLNQASPQDFAAALDGIYEHSAWIAERAAAHRPFRSLAQLKLALVQVVREATRAEQLGLICAHPELAGKAMLARTLTPESGHEQRSAGLVDCSAEELARLQQLNSDWNARFGFPFILAVRGPRGTGLTRQQIITHFERRLRQLPEAAFVENLRQIHRIAEIRLDDRFGQRPLLGEQVLDACAALARHSEPGFAEQGQLTVTYLSPAHQACAADLMQAFREAGFDEVAQDAVGNVVGLYQANQPGAPRLLTGSHYDTVRNAGPHDGRLGIFCVLAAVAELHRRGERLPFALELVAFAEEEGQRFAATFLAASALTGDFDPAWLDQRDSDGISLLQAMQAAGLPGSLQAIAGLRRDPQAYLGYVEIHIEQGPVLAGLDLPLGVVSGINGSRRFVGEVIGVASHAGTTPMAARRDAACAVAELALALERRASGEPGLVGTMGQLEVPQGSINVVPGRCRFSLDIRAPSDAQRDACVADIEQALAAICARRGLGFQLTPTLSAAAAPSDPIWQARWERAVEQLGLPLQRLPSGAGHDAMMLHRRLPQAMLFVRGENDGISHNPLESTSSHDTDLAVRALLALLHNLSHELEGAQPHDDAGGTGP